MKSWYIWVFNTILPLFGYYMNKDFVWLLAAYNAMSAGLFLYMSESKTRKKHGGKK